MSARRDRRAARADDRYRRSQSPLWDAQPQAGADRARGASPPPRAARLNAGRRAELSC